jgi:hypothetical protein
MVSQRIYIGGGEKAAEKRLWGPVGTNTIGSFVLWWGMAKVIKIYD